MGESPVVMGIDPGSRRMGYGFVRRVGSRLVVLDFGVLQQSERLPLAQRLSGLYDGLEGVIARHAPDRCGLEDLFHARNARSALALGHARGVAMLAAARAGLEIEAVAPAMVKKSVVGSGRATKQQVQLMVKVLLGLVEAPAEDAADALAVAICIANQHR